MAWSEDGLVVLGEEGLGRSEVHAEADMRTNGACSSVDGANGRGLLESETWESVTHGLICDVRHHDSNDSERIGWTATGGFRARTEAGVYGGLLPKRRAAHAPRPSFTPSSPPSRVADSRHPLTSRTHSIARPHLPSGCIMPPSRRAPGPAPVPAGPPEAEPQPQPQEPSTSEHPPHTLFVKSHLAPLLKITDPYVSPDYIRAHGIKCRRLDFKSGATLLPRLHKPDPSARAFTRLFPYQDIRA